MSDQSWQADPAWLAATGSVDFLGDAADRRFFVIGAGESAVEIAARISEELSGTRAQVVLVDELDYSRVEERMLDVLAGPWPETPIELTLTPSAYERLEHILASPPLVELSRHDDGTPRSIRETRRRPRRQKKGKRR